MNNSWKLWTTIGAGLLVVAGPSVSGAAALDVPSPQQGVAVPNPPGPPNSYNPGPQADGGQTAKDSAGGPQTGGETHDAPTQASTPGTNAPATTGPATPTPNGTATPGTTVPGTGTTSPRTGRPAPTGALPPERATPKQAPSNADNMPADPKMPAGGDTSDTNLPNVTAPQDGPGPVGPVN